ncbi:MAG TPA: STAS domain-containing protein [Terriglobales bacterium]|nr:STAS domain-containing protein [Terriglobales bacterium]
MLGIHIERIGELAVVECKGRLVRSQAASELRTAVTSQREARIIVLDLSEIDAIEGGGLGMLLFLHRWAHDHGIQFKVFNPSTSVRDRLRRASSIPELEITTPTEMLALPLTMSFPAAFEISLRAASSERSKDVRREGEVGGRA